MKQITSKDLLYSKGNYSPLFCNNYKGKNLKKKIYESLCYIPETNIICKSTILQFRKKTDTLASTIIKRNLIKIKKKVNDHYP